MVGGWKRPTLSCNASRPFSRLSPSGRRCAWRLAGDRRRACASDYDIGLYFRESAGLDIHRLLDAAKRLVDDPAAAKVTEVGGWGPWIGGGGWLTIAGTKVDEALIRRFQWEILFSIENAETAVLKGDQAYIAGCAFRSLACVAQVLFALNRRYLINEKGALAAAARLPLTLGNLAERANSVWQAVGLRAFDAALAELGSIEREVAGLTEAAD